MELKQLKEILDPETSNPKVTFVTFFNKFMEWASKIKESSKTAYDLNMII